MIVLILNGGVGYVFCDSIDFEWRCRLCFCYSIDCEWRW